jgi:hypothetical protein
MERLLIGHFPNEQGSAEKLAFDWRKVAATVLNAYQQSDRTKAQAGTARNRTGVDAPLHLPYATNKDGNSDGKITFPVLISLIDLVSAGNTTRDPKQALHFGQCQT